MSKVGVLAILEAENLGRFNWLEDRSPRPDEVGLLTQGAGWRVCSTDARAAAQYDKWHPDEGEALADFLTRVRAANQYFSLREERLGQQAVTQVLSRSRGRQAKRSATHVP